MPIEVCVDSLESALAAVEGGAERLLICSEIDAGGLTPSTGLFICISRVLKCKVDLRVMIRPRSGDFCYNKNEVRVARFEIVQLRNVGAKGFAFGVLDSEGNLDRDSCEILLSDARGLPCTLNRAFDLTRNWETALKAAIELGFDSILTSGQAEPLFNGTAVLHELARRANGRIEIIAGPADSPSTIEKLMRRTSIRWFHGTFCEMLPVPPTQSQIAIMGYGDSSGRKRTWLTQVTHVYDTLRKTKSD